MIPSGRWQVICVNWKVVFLLLYHFFSSSVFTFLVFQINVYFFFFYLFWFIQISFGFSCFFSLFFLVIVGHYQLFLVLFFVFCCFSQFFPPLLVSLCLSQFSQFSQCFYAFLREGFITKTLHLIHKKGLESPPPKPVIHFCKIYMIHMREFLSPSTGLKIK